MKKLFLFSALVIFAVACSNNPKEEAAEERKRDSMDQNVENANQKFVDSLIQADEAKEKQKSDSAGHEGHDHSGHDHEGHSH